MKVTMGAAQNLSIEFDPAHSDPILPVKRHISSQAIPELGVLLADGKPTVYMGNMYEIKTLKDCPKKEYKDFDDLLADGWVVD